MTLRNKIYDIEDYDPDVAEILHSLLGRIQYLEIQMRDIQDAVRELEGDYY